MPSGSRVPVSTNGEAGPQLSPAAHTKCTVCTFTCDTLVEMDYHWICNHYIGAGGVGYRGWKRTCDMGQTDPAPLCFEQRKEICAFHLQARASASPAEDYSGHPPPGGRPPVKERREHEYPKHAGADADGAGVGDTAGSAANVEQSLLLAASGLLLAVVTELRGTGMRQLQWALINKQETQLVRKTSREDGRSGAPAEGALGRTTHVQPEATAAAMEAKRCATDFSARMKQSMACMPGSFEGLSLVQASTYCIAATLDGYSRRANRRKTEQVDAHEIARESRGWLRMARAHY